MIHDIREPKIVVGRMPKNHLECILFRKICNEPYCSECDKLIDLNSALEDNADYQFEVNRPD